ncbi:MAG: GGDEF domain-containing protein [Treponema sp.]|nr:GGDEF domain-containing protein [Treponema sp.]
MLYAITPAALLILNLILNFELFTSYGFSDRNQSKQNIMYVRYNQFLLTAICYTVVDMTWGILYEHREVQIFFPFIYYLTVFYFIFMLLTMLSWTHYMVAYLDNNGRPSQIFVHVVRVLVIIGLVCLILNRFYHFIFFYNEKNEYVGEVGKNISFFLQIVFYVGITANMIAVAHKSKGRQKVRCKAVAVTSILLCVFLTFQIINAFFPFYAVGLMFGICLIHTFVQAGEKKEKEIHDNIALTMAEDYEAIFYIEIASGEYMSFSKSQKYMSMPSVENEKDFFKDTLESIERCVYPDDKEFAKSFYNKTTMLKKLEGRLSFSFKYRVIIKGEPRFFLFTVMREHNGQYLILYEKDIEDELNAEKALKENAEKTVTFGQIAESLASNYDEIYYVNIEKSSYVCYQVNNIYGQLEINKSGKDFYSECLSNIPRIVYKKDCERVVEFIDRKNMIAALEKRRDYSITYRIIASDTPKYTRMRVRKSSDGTHFIIGVENVDDEIQKEKEHINSLKNEKELARRDELTGVKNKTAYKEFETSVQGSIDNCMDYLSFALVLCDANNLKQINDTFGHKAGDEYIKEAAKLLCEIFIHSPVFRVGGDEFVVFLQGSNYESRHALMDKLRTRVLENKNTGSGVILASGMSEYMPESDNFVSDIFERADKEMYENKKNLKNS